MLHVRHCLTANYMPCRLSGLVNHLRGEHTAVRALESSKHDTVMAECVYDAHAKYLKTPLGLACNSRPEVTDSGRMPAGLADIAGINGQSLDAYAALEVLLCQLEVETHHVNAAFLEVAAIGLLIGCTERAQLREISFLHHNIKN